MTERPSTFMARMTSRRRFLAGAGAGAVGLFLAACSGDGDNSDGEATATSTSEATPTGTATTEATTVATESAGGYPRTITHAFGELTLDARPERIVLLSDAEPLDSLLQLGGTPVSFVFSGGYIGRLPEWVADLVPADVPQHEDLGFGVYDLERIVTEQPDLILGVWMGEEGYDALSKIAPTVSLKEVEETTWQEIHQMMGAILGEEELADQQIAAVEGLFDTEAARVADDQDRSVAVAYEFSDQLNIHGERAQIAKLVKGLGFEVVAPGPDITVTAIERWSDVADADILLSPSFSEERMDAQLSNPVFSGLPAVQNGSWIILGPELAQAGYLESALSTEWLIPRIADAIIEAAEGRGESAA